MPRTILHLSLVLVVSVAFVALAANAQSEYHYAPYTGLRRSNVDSSMEIQIHHTFQCMSGNSLRLAYHYIRYENDQIGLTMQINFTQPQENTDQDARDCFIVSMQPITPYSLTAQCQGVAPSSIPHLRTIPPGLRYNITEGCVWESGVVASETYTDYDVTWNSFGPLDPTSILGRTIHSDFDTERSMRITDRSMFIRLDANSDPLIGGLSYCGDVSTILVMDSATPGVQPYRRRLPVAPTIYPTTGSTPGLTIRLGSGFAGLNTFAGFYDITFGVEYVVRLWMFHPCHGLIYEFEVDTVTFAPPTIDPVADKPDVVAPEPYLRAVLDNGYMYSDVRFSDSFTDESVILYTFASTTTPGLVFNITHKRAVFPSAGYTQFDLPLDEVDFVPGVNWGNGNVTSGEYDLTVRVENAATGGWLPEVLIPRVHIAREDYEDYPLVPEAYIKPLDFEYMGGSGMHNGFLVIVSSATFFVYNLSLSVDQTIYELDNEANPTAMMGHEVLAVLVFDDFILFHAQDGTVFSRYSFHPDTGVMTHHGTAMTGYQEMLVEANAIDYQSEQPWFVKQDNTLCYVLWSTVVCGELTETFDVTNVGAAAPMKFNATLNDPAVQNVILAPGSPYMWVIVWSTDYVNWACVMTALDPSDYVCTMIATETLKSFTAFASYDEEQGHSLRMAFDVAREHTGTLYDGKFEECTDCTLFVDMRLFAPSLGQGHCVVRASPTHASIREEWGFSRIPPDAFIGHRFGSEVGPRLEGMILLSPVSSFWEPSNQGMKMLMYDDNIRFRSRFPLSQFEVQFRAFSFFTVGMFYDARANKVVRLGSSLRATTWPRRLSALVYSLNDGFVSTPLAPTVALVPTDPNDIHIEVRLPTTPRDESMSVDFHNIDSGDRYVFSMRAAPLVNVTFGALVRTSSLAILAADGTRRLMLQDTFDDPPAIPNGNYSVMISYVDADTGTDVDVVVYNNLVVFTSTTASPDCSNHGILSLVVCTCDEGFYGPICAQTREQCTAQHCLNGALCSTTVLGNFTCRLPCDGICASTGSCVDEACECDEHFFGDTCGWNQTTCDSALCDVSSGRECTRATNGTVACTLTHCALTCSLLHGTCVDKECVCAPGWDGPNCTTSLCPACGAHGSCVVDACVCTGGWDGPLCDVSPCEPCGENESCVDGECVCNEGFFGDDCSCTVACGSHGECGGGACACDAGFFGAQCALNQTACDALHCDGGSHCEPHESDGSVIVCADDPIPACLCTHLGVCANVTDAHSCTCPEETYGRYCNSTRAACTAEHCGSVLGFWCALTTAGAVACVDETATVEEEDTFDEKKALTIGISVAAAAVVIVIGGIAAVVRRSEWMRVRSHE